MICGVDGEVRDDDWMASSSNRRHGVETKIGEGAPASGCFPHTLAFANHQFGIGTLNKQTLLECQSTCIALESSCSDF